MVLHRHVERGGRLTGEPDERIAVRAVVRDLEFDDGIIVADDDVHILADLAALVVQNPDAVGIRLRAVMLGQAKLLVGAQHTTGFHASQLALRDVDAAGQVRIVLRDRNQIALVHILCARDDLHRLTGAAVDHADPHMVGVFMLFHRQDLADDDVFDLRVHALRSSRPSDRRGSLTLWRRATA